MDASVFNPNGNVDNVLACVFEASVFESMSAADLESNIIDFVSTLTLPAGSSEFGYNHTFTTTKLQQYDVHEFSQTMTKAFADLADNSVTSDITTGVEYTVCVVGTADNALKKVYHTNIISNVTMTLNLGNVSLNSSTENNQFVTCDVNLSTNSTALTNIYGFVSAQDYWNYNVDTNLYIKWNVNKYNIYNKENTIVTTLSCDVDYVLFVDQVHSQTNPVFISSYADGRVDQTVVPYDENIHYVLTDSTEYTVAGAYTNQAYIRFKTPSTAQTFYLASYTNPSSGWWTRSSFQVVSDASVSNHRINTFNTQVMSKQSVLSPLLSITSSGTHSVSVDKAVDSLGDLVDLFKVNSGFLYIWASDVNGGVSNVVRHEKNVYFADVEHKSHTLLTNVEFGEFDDTLNVEASLFNPLSNITSLYVSAFESTVDIGNLDNANIIACMETQADVLTENVLQYNQQMYTQNNIATACTTVSDNTLFVITDSSATNLTNGNHTTGVPDPDMYKRLSFGEDKIFETFHNMYNSSTNARVIDFNSASSDDHLTWNKNWSVSAWFQPQQADFDLFSMGNVEGIERFYGTNVSSTNVTFALKINDNPVQNDVTAAHKGANTWNHFIYNHTYTLATQTEAVEAYLNGELIGTYSVTLATAAGDQTTHRHTDTRLKRTVAGRLSTVVSMQIFYIMEICH